RQLSCFHLASLSRPTATNHTNTLHPRSRAWRGVDERAGLLRIRASPFASRLAGLLTPNRVHFVLRSIWYLLVCSPPRLAAAQLTFSSRPEHGLAGTGLSPVRETLLGSALARASRSQGQLHSLRAGSPSHDCTSPARHPLLPSAPLRRRSVARASRSQDRLHSLRARCPSHDCTSPARHPLLPSALPRRRSVARASR